MRGDVGRSGIAKRDTLLAETLWTPSANTGKGSFQIVGLDFMVDEEFGVHFIEANGFPGFTWSINLDSRGLPDTPDGASDDAFSALHVWPRAPHSTTTRLVAHLRAALRRAVSAAHFTDENAPLGIIGLTTGAERG